jgi:hypothetical protein
VNTSVLPPPEPRSAYSNIARAIFSPPGGRNVRRVERGPRPVEPAGFAQAVEQCSVKPRPHPGYVPLPEAPPASHPRAAAHLLGKHLPRNSCLEHEQDARKSGAIVHPRATTLEFRRLLRQEWFDYGPKFVGYEWVRHGRRILDHGVLLGALIHPTAWKGSSPKFGCRGSRKFATVCGP